jgi:hypothetical protein
MNEKSSAKTNMGAVALLVILVAVVIITASKLKPPVKGSPVTYHQPTPIFVYEAPVFRPGNRKVVSLIKATGIMRARLRKWSYANRQLLKTMLGHTYFRVRINQQFLANLPTKAPFSLTANEIKFRWDTQFQARASPNDTVMSFDDQPVLFAVAKVDYTSTVCPSGRAYIYQRALSGEGPQVPIFRRYSFLNARAQHSSPLTPFAWAYTRKATSKARRPLS